MGPLCESSFFRNILATVNQHPPVHHKGWMVSSDKNSLHFVWTIYLACSYLFSYLFTYKWDLFPTELVTQMKPNINSVEVHSQLSNNRHPVDGVLAGVLVHSGLISLHYTRQGDLVHIIAVVWLKSDHHLTWKDYLLARMNQNPPAQHTVQDGVVCGWSNMCTRNNFL
jgi:hypothetical protein